MKTREKSEREKKTDGKEPPPLYKRSLHEICANHAKQYGNLVFTYNSVSATITKINLFYTQLRP
jgi:hypothetical protein